MTTNAFAHELAVASYIFLSAVAGAMAGFFLTFWAIRAWKRRQEKQRWGSRESKD